MSGFDINRVLANAKNDPGAFKYYREVTPSYRTRGFIYGGKKATFMSRLRNRPIAVVTGLLICGACVAIGGASWYFKAPNGVDVVAEHSARLKAELEAYETSLKQRFQ